MADEFLAAAEKTLPRTRGYRAGGPSLLLLYHAAELYLKAHLRSNGTLVKDLREMQHDLSLMIDKSTDFGLRLPSRARKIAAVIRERNEYVRARYMVAREKDALHESQVLKFAKDVREAVRISLDFDVYGNPQGKPWRSAEPADYLEAGKPKASVTSKH